TNKSDKKEVENPYSIDVNKQLPALKIFLCAVDVDSYGKYKSDMTKTIKALRTVPNIIDLAPFKLKISQKMIAEEVTKMKVTKKITNFLETSIEILIWYKYFGPIITVGNTLGDSKT
ncbi:10848_t:CDS:2, partial [Racocetra persica]